ncbi:MAG: WYL domain-containing protein [Nanoarchaeota archaeon]|nr:WYL domain-containing protein [Nanoarchaeota archaeon]
MNKEITARELRKIYQILKAFNEGLIVNPSEEWELDYYDESVADKKGIVAILRKIENLLPKDDKEKINKNILRRKYDTFNSETDEKVYSKIEKAFNERRIIQIGYFDMGSAEIIKREIDVYHKTRRYVIAYCHLRNAIRKFRTSRMVSAKLTDKNYSIPADFDKNRY